jgi:arylsulfatase A-like enzyme
MDPHHPYKPPSEYTTVPDQNIDRLWQQLNDDPTKISDTEVDTLRDLYRSEVEYLTDSISALLNKLEQEGQLKDTLVVITADHGEEFRDHGDLLHKPKLHHELVEVPLLITGGSVTESTTVGGLVSSLDIPATIVDAIGHSIPDSWRGDPIQGSEGAISGCFTELSHTSGEGGEVVPERIKVSYRTEDWTFIHDRQAGTESLYSRHDDLKEQHDVGNDHDDLLTEMQEAVDTHLDNIINETATSRNTSVDESVEERLGDLGYR